MDVSLQHKVCAVGKPAHTKDSSHSLTSSLLPVFELVLPSLLLFLHIVNYPSE